MDTHHQTVQDLNARIHYLEQELQDHKSALERVNSELHTFTYKISHDLHAPLRAILTYITMIESDFRNKVLDEDAQRMISRVFSNANHMKQMLDGLLEFVRTGNKELNMQRLDMHALVKEISDQMLQSYPDRKVTFKLSDLAGVMADEELMKKAWTHLISNAVKFSGKKTEGIIAISSRQEDGQVVYTIEDNGDGFDMSYYDKLFGIFQRLHHATDFEGTGIGLAIVQRIMNRHQGKVWGEGKVKEGSAFHFSIPDNG